MDTKHAYNIWSEQYDTNHNKTRDLEATALRTELSRINFSNCLEIGCGTGKNTEWLIQKADHILAVDLSEQMLQKAKEKIQDDKVEFRQADILKPWEFGAGMYDLVSFSLVLEHIEDLQQVFAEVSKALKPGGHVYIGELHPFKQYAGSKARFETEEGVQVVSCFTHHVSDFTRQAQAEGLEIVGLNEYFDEDDRTGVPRILTVLFQKA